MSTSFCQVINGVFFAVLWSCLVSNSSIEMLVMKEEDVNAHFFITQNKLIYYIEIALGIIAFLGDRIRMPVLHLPNFGLQLYLIYFTFAYISTVYHVKANLGYGNLPKIMMAMLWIRILPYIILLTACVCGFCVILKNK